MKALVIALLLLAGCAHIGQRAAKAPPLPAPPTQVIPAVSSVDSNPPAAFPAEYEDYYVGMIADADDPTFAYRPGDLIVQTRPARLGFGTNAENAPLFQRGPVTTARMANDHPEPTDAELAALVARSQRTISGLTEENERLLTQVRDLRNPAAKPSPKAAGVPGKASTAAAPADPEASRLNVITPNSDYVIELDPSLLAPSEPATTNPFVQLYLPPVSWRELAIHVSAAVPGPNPTAIIDDEPYSVGERFKDLTIYRIEADTVYLRKDSFLLACPVSDRLLKLRLP
jgi:hypothetical protein